MPATTTYTASVANGIGSVTLTATKNDSNATVAITSDDDTTSPGVAELDLIVGSNTLTVTVTAEDGTTEQEYTITVTRAGALAACEIDAFWCTTLTVGEHPIHDPEGYCGPGADTAKCGYGSLGDDDFTLDGTGYTVESLRWGTTHPSRLHLTLDKDFPDTSLDNLTLRIGALSFALADALRGNDDNDVNNNYRWLLPEFSDLRDLGEGDTITAQLFEGATNTAATGQPGFSGTAAVGQTLTATTSGITDADGKTKAENGDSGYAYTYQWILVDGNTETDISGETSSTYTPSSSDVGKTIRVRVSFTDDLDNAEGPFTSEQTAAVTTAAGVTVSTTTLTVTEQDTTGDGYTVALDTEPTANVTVTVAGHAGTDVTPDPTTLTFTASNWETAQTVTVTAGNDTDTTDDSVALTHSAASADNDYGGIAIPGVAVTVSDNDTARVTGLSVTSGNARLAVNWTAVDNATGYKVQWKSGGQDYNTGDRQFTVISGTTTSHTITGLANGTEYTARVSATRTDANDGPPSAEAKGTPAAPGVTVSKTALTVTEQDTTGDGYTVALDTEPTADVAVTVAGHAGTDVTPNPTILTFTASNWEHGADGDGDRGRRCGHDGRFGRADPQRGERGQRLRRHRDPRRGGDGERQRHRAGDGGVGHIGQRATGGELDGGGQRHGLQGAVEVGRPGLQHRRPAVHGHLRFDREPHDHGSRQRHRVHGAGERDADRRQRRSAVGGGEGHAGGADRAGGHGVDDGADGDGGGHDRGRLHGGAGYRADGGCHGDGGRALGHGRDPEPGHPDVHRVELGNGADGDGDRGRRCGHGGRFGRADPQRGERGQRLRRHRDPRRGGDGERQRHRAGDGGVGHIGQRATGGELDGGGQRHGLQGAVEVGRPGLQHRRPAVHGHLRFDREPHDHGSRQRHRVHGAGERDADRRQRRPAVGGGEGHPGGADRAGGHGVEDGADGDGGGHDRGRLHGGAGYRADGECHGDGRRARGHRRDPEPGPA